MTLKARVAKLRETHAMLALALDRLESQECFRSPRAALDEAQVLLGLAERTARDANILCSYYADRCLLAATRRLLLRGREERVAGLRDVASGRTIAP